MVDKTGARQLETPKLVRANQREWLENVRERANQGEPFGIFNGDDCEEIFNVMDIPFMVINYWNQLIGTKQMGIYYNDVLAKRGYPTAHFAWGLASTMDNDPDTAPWGGLPTEAAIIIGSTREDVEMRITELWAREYGCTVWPLEFCLGTSLEKLLPPRWWEIIKDDWNKLIEPHKLDERIQEEKALITHLEVTTGKKFSLAKLYEAMDLLNEQMDYWKKARDLIAETVPCPVSLRDQLAMYQVMWHRGTTMGRDFLKAYYEEVKERAENGIAAFPGEKIRLMWMPGIPPQWERFVEEKYGAVTVCSSFSAISADCYARTIKNDDPMRAMVSRHILLFIMSPDWMLKEAKLHKCDGVVSIKRVTTPITKNYFEANGMPYLELPGDLALSMYRDDDEIRSALSEFIETRILS
ncbi:2-hydroxyacyl-CoA dehydratase [Thermodesulfobacteriota bacterium]